MQSLSWIKVKEPLTVIDASSLGMTLRAHPEELNNIFLRDRLNRLEARMQSMQVTMDNIIAKQFEENIASINAMLCKCSVQRKRQSLALVVFLLRGISL